MLCSRCRQPVFQPRVDISPAEINASLRSGFGLSVSAADVSNMLLSCDKDMDDYEAEIVRLRTRILYIQRQQDRLKDHKRKVQSLGAPIRQLPNEILRCIFDYACAENDLQEFPWPRIVRQHSKLASPAITYLPAMSIASVCMRWRLLALATPSLWSRLKLEIASAPATSQTPSEFISIVQLFLDRSQQDLLMLELEITGEVQPSDPIVLTILAQNARRWKTFRFTGDLEVSEVSSFSQLHLPELVELSIDVSRSVPSADDIARFAQSPKLRSLTTDTLVSPPGTLWQQLTRVYICADYGQVDKIIDACPNVSDLTLWEYFGDVPLSPCAPPRTSNTITSLTVEVSDSEKDVALFDMVLSSLTLPSLLELHISNLRARVPYQRPWPKRALKEFIMRSSCKIEILSISCVCPTDKDLVDCLQVLPSLRKLSVNDDMVPTEKSPITSRLIASLHGLGQCELTDSGSPLVPKLQYLSLNLDGVDFVDKLFIRMVSTRWLPDSEYESIVGLSSLREVLVHFRGRKVDTVAYRPLLDLDKMGLRVVLTGKETKDK
ncbi:hypothetical protein BT96DRAFT_663091 [Gymnopus androsaceus JB14]|uniref:Uncharacterized protein n=1 Tax=Gymnopus androsaceus JB14 TaxID=1447944 RepID=A0A6A4IIX1_9AGAR|nr:hypothetical protein BT96DRAFT_663091 [Gymnopus androsaceus JB14]